MGTSTHGPGWRNSSPERAQARLGVGKAALRPQPRPRAAKLLLPVPGGRWQEAALVCLPVHTPWRGRAGEHNPGAKASENN